MHRPDFKPPYPPVVATLIVAGALVTLARAASFPFLAIYLSVKLGLDAAHIGLLLGAGPLVGIGAGLFGGALSDRIGRWPVLLGSVVLSVLAFSGLAWAQQVWQFGLLNAALSVASAMQEPVSRALIGDEARNEARLIAFSHRYMSINLAFAIGPLIGAFAGIERITLLFSATAAVQGAIALALLPFAWQALRRHRAKRGPAELKRDGILAGVIAASKDRRLAWFIFGAFLTATVHGQFSVTLGQYLAASMLDGVRLLGLLMAVNAVTVVAFSQPAARIARRISPFQAVAAGALFMAAGTLGFGLMAGQVSLSLAMVVFTMGEVLIIPAEFLLVDGIATENRRGAYHGAMGLSTLGNAAGPALGGILLSAFGGAITFAVLAAMALLAVVAFGRGRSLPPAQPLEPAKVEIQPDRTLRALGLMSA